MLVEGVTKLGRLHYSALTLFGEHAPLHRKLKDIRVLIIAF